MKRFYIEMDQTWHWVWAEKIKNQLWFHFKGKTQCVEFKSKKNRRESTEDFIETGEIKAPMPGKIKKIFKVNGDSVTKGETIVIMEAMKMEYSLEADVDGTIEEIDIDENSQVNVGQILVKITKAKHD
ncbi:MAG: acetyl-CoA carboxylase biotin carboxyl carrier protein subunit [Bdellovibrionaceae bacterium]|nr:acetyl-CoA carboxylase biotin carboxyl carrier protein subunit [Pseudobdellovibrionaceae bacterium]